jgi:hypothetical protein
LFAIAHYLYPALPEELTLLWTMHEGQVFMTGHKAEQADNIILTLYSIGLLGVSINASGSPQPPLGWTDSAQDGYPGEWTLNILPTSKRCWYRERQWIYLT